jgi:hypothetical protein
LIAVITTDVVATQVVESGLRLTGKQLDSKHDPDRVWSDTVLPRSKNPNFKPSAFVPLIMLQKFRNPETLDFSKVPDREVSASHLRKTFHELRGEFSKCFIADGPEAARMTLKTFLFSAPGWNRYWRFNFRGKRRYAFLRIVARF